MDRTIYPLTLFYDAGCPVCSLEMDHLRERNRDGWLRFVDISAPGFDPAPHGASLAAMDAEIHGLTASGAMLRGVEVLRLAYDAAGLGWVMRPTGWAPLRPLADAGYRVFARHRRAISRAAAPLIAAVRAARARRTVERMRACRDGACSVDSGHSGRPS
jgi:predicted DCC family thiol-disulfide oxidoreductase YuxK